jgi:hypothetical protein
MAENRNYVTSFSDSPTLTLISNIHKVLGPDRPTDLHIDGRIHMIL